VRQWRLRLRCAREKSPKKILNRALNPLALGHSQCLARLGIGKSNSSRAFQKNQHWKGVENLLPGIRIRVFVKIQFHGLPGTAAAPARAEAWIGMNPALDGALPYLRSYAAQLPFNHPQNRSTGATKVISIGQESEIRSQ